MDRPVSSEKRRLGRVVGGSLSQGLEVRLEPGVSVEDLAQGSYVVIAGQKETKFFGMITDVQLGATSDQVKMTPPNVSDRFLADVISGTSIFGTLSVAPYVMWDEADPGVKPVKTIPAHFREVFTASAEEVAQVFGADDDKHLFIGRPLDMEAKVCLDLTRVAERSTGVFGKSGTGKTYITRWLLLGLAQKTNAVNLIFDMHNEYGWQGSDRVKGLQQLLSGRVAVFTLDEASTRSRGGRPDFVVEIGYEHVLPEDMETLQQEMDLSTAALDCVHGLARRFGANNWLARFLEVEPGEDTDALAAATNLHAGSLQALRRKLERMMRDLDFLKPKVFDDSVARILEHLERGKHVILEFGSHGDRLHAYILVANILTRRIHEVYRERKEQSLGGKAPEPRPLVITIEEAHKFLSPRVAEFTIFGTIAREMRKYNVTLLVVDQRPSGIYDDVMSQIATRITCLLDDEKDVAAVLSGIHGSQQLRSVLSRLNTKQEALILGHAVPMPVVVRTREYGTIESYREIQMSESRRSSNGDDDKLDKLLL